MFTKRRATGSKVKLVANLQFNAWMAKN